MLRDHIHRLINTSILVPSYFQKGKCCEDQLGSIRKFRLGEWECSRLLFVLLAYLNYNYIHYVQQEKALALWQSRIAA